ncbi:hypothetical protein ['Camptotheca acuminata' phytoplasma]|uniref:hypothetical protein n=1 Tax='Camptotheca acuminata' phytoplasma TaxID=3239192 RepID=UPI00351A65A5
MKCKFKRHLTQQRIHIFSFLSLFSLLALGHLYLFYPLTKGTSSDKVLKIGYYRYCCSFSYAS